ncbi:TPA: hypothetical protein DEP21_04270 [Patescibacteria group bacterium]|nr:hypothetical protein [Candidatus Gracilibacteria bacterium]
MAKILYLYHMAEYMVHLQQYDKAMDYYKEAYSIAVKKNDANSQKYISSAMASLYADQGIFDKAYHQTFITDAAKDSLMNETIAKERAESEKNSKVRLQAAEIETQKAQNRVKQAEIERQEAENKIKQVEIEKQEAEIKKRNAGIGLV